MNAVSGHAVPGKSRNESQTNLRRKKFAHDIGIVDVGGDIRPEIPVCKVMREDAGQGAVRGQTDKRLLT